jgi:putative endopeptidase
MNAALVFGGLALVLTAGTLLSWWRARVWHKKVQADDPFFTVTDGHAQVWDSPAALECQWRFVAANLAYWAIVLWIGIAVASLVSWLNQSGTKAVTKAAQAKGIRIEWMDRSVDPGVDFNAFANGGWMRSNSIPPQYSQWSVSHELMEKTEDILHNILKRVSANRHGLKAGSNEQKLADFWRTAMDEQAAEAAGLKPISGELARIDAIATAGDLASVIARLHRIGVGVFFDVSAAADMDDSTTMIAHASQSGLGLPDRDYYLNDDERSKALQERYCAHIASMFQLMGDAPQAAAAQAKRVFDLETRLARASMSLEDQHDPESVRHKMTVAEFLKLFGSFQGERYLKDLGAPTFQIINVQQPKFFEELNTLLAATNPQEFKPYLRWHLIRSCAPYLSSRFVDQSFEFYGKELSGAKEQKPRFKRAIALIDRHLGEALGQLYVKETFPPESKRKVLELVAQIKAALRESIEKSDWMSAQTRKNALEKLELMEPLIGYPDKWQDYSALQIDDGSLMGNVLRAREFAASRNLGKIGKLVDRTEWDMTPQTVNAYYAPDRNQLVFPAAILQPPFFDPSADDAFNLGSIGATIGHEKTHGFDDYGAKFDARGNLKDWWTAEDKANFEKQVALIVEQYGSYTVAGGIHLRGKVVAGEAIADLGGLKLAYRALQKVLETKGRTIDANGFTDEQRFFIAYGQSWATISTDKHDELQAKTNEHPPAKFRVNGTLANMPEFQRAFNLKDGSPMMLPLEKRCRLW